MDTLQNTMPVLFNCDYTIYTVALRQHSCLIEDTQNNYVKIVNLGLLPTHCGVGIIDEVFILTN